MFGNISNWTSSLNERNFLNITWSIIIYDLNVKHSADNINMIINCSKSKEMKNISSVNFSREN